MEETIKSAKDKTVTSISEKQSGPKGIGMAVAFDWGLAVQMLVVPVLPLLFGRSGPQLGQPVVLVGSLLSAILIAIFGEGIRRGWKWTRYVQIVFNSLGFLGGFFTLLNVWQSSKQGSYWPIVTAVILLVFSPLIAWRLSRPETARWFATISSAEARKRHGGMWPFYIALWAIVGGGLQSLAIFLR